MAKRKRSGARHNRPPYVELMLQAFRTMIDAIPEEADQEYSRYDWGQPPRGYNPGVITGDLVGYVYWPPVHNSEPIVLGVTFCCADAARDAVLLANVWQLKSYDVGSKKHCRVKTVPNVRGNNSQAPICDHCGATRRLVDVLDGEILQ